VANDKKGVGTYYVEPQIKDVRWGWD